MTALLRALELAKHYPTAQGILHAVDRVNLVIEHGESVGLVGESGCGKSTLVRLLARLINPTDGAILFDEADITAVSLRRFVHDPRRAKIQVVFQDPTESLNPSLSVFDAIADPIRRLVFPGNRLSLAQQVHQAIAMVGLPRELEGRLPHQLSGGQRARVGIARAIAVRPSLLILDEPTSALDVSVQAVILHLLADLRARLGISYLFVSHDLNVVRLLCDRIAVMYLGKIVEEARTEDIFDRPSHPYTRALLASIPDPTRRSQRPWRLKGSASSPIDPPPHVCRFFGRCPRQKAYCSEAMPDLRMVGENHFSACHFPDDRSPPSRLSAGISAIQNPRGVTA